MLLDEDKGLNRKDSPSEIIKLMSKDENWMQTLEEKGIKIKEKDNLMMFNYGIGCDFTDPVVQECRGIIFDKRDWSVACWPFRKFCNYFEDGADKINWETARVQEKLDGSIVKLFFNKKDEKWQWATNGTIDAKDASSESMFSDNFMDIIEKADNYKDVMPNRLDRDTTYIFELVGPENKIVVYYPQTHLFHIGTRNNITGQEKNIDIGIEKPKEYKLKTFDEAMEAVEKLNENAENERAEHEGFVVVDGDWNRVKIKSPEYLMLHHFTNGVLLNKSKIIELINSDDIDINNIKEQFPEYTPVFDFYENEKARITKEADEKIKEARKLLSETDRKTVAQKYVKDKYSTVIFKSLNNNKPVNELLSEMPKIGYEKLFGEYKN